MEQSKRKGIFWAVFAVAVVAVLLAITIIYRTYMRASIISLSGSQISLARGQEHTLVLPESSVNRTVSICRGFTRADCRILGEIEPGNIADITIEKDYPLGPASLVITTKDAPDQLVRNINVSQ